MNSRRVFAALVGVLGGATACSGGPTTNDYVNVCVWELSCPPSAGAGTSGAQCVALQAELLASNLPVTTSAVNLEYGCASSANSCDSFAQCLSMNHGAAYCSAHTGMSCDGSVVVDCTAAGTNGWATVQDCSAQGMMCQTANAVAVCTDGTACDAAAAARCNGNNAITCNATADLEVSTPCPSGSTCGIVNGAAVCVYGPPCQQQATRCDGNTLVLCETSTNHELRIDCASAVQGTCVIANNAPQCVPTANQCSITGPDQCNGNQLQICVNGNYQSIDCTRYGFHGCGATAGTLSSVGCM